MLLLLPLILHIVLHTATKAQRYIKAGLLVYVKMLLLISIIKFILKSLF